MRILSGSGLTVAPIAGRIQFPDHSLTVVVKGLFRLDQGQITHLLEDEELAFPTGDLPLREDDGGEGEIHYASDFAFYKPHADLMLVGRCHPPNEEAVPWCRVTFQVGDNDRTLQVFGDRWWTGGTMDYRMTEPQPFTEMELSWERAYGGPRCPDNPVGRGDQPVTLEDGQEVWPLPNVEYPETPISSPGDRPSPAGFGPIPQTWEPRRARAGTYDDHWLETRWPWFPEDLDWSLFNAAPATLQVKGFLKGDEELYLENLRPGQARFQTRLPGLRVRCFVNELPADVDPPPPTEKERRDWTLPPRDELEFREIPLNLDTLWLDAEEGLVALVWRGHGPVRDEEFGEVQELFIITEPLDEDPADLDACRTAFWDLVDEEEGLEEGETAPAADVLVDESAGEEEGDDAEEEEVIAFEPSFDAMEKLRTDLEAMGIDPDNPPEPTEEERERARQYFREQGMDDVVALLGGDAEEEEATEEEGPSPPWTRDRVVEKYAEDRDLTGADLRGLDLSGLDLSGAILREANLVDVRLTGTDLSQADLTSAALTGADLGEAQLTGATLLGCDLSRARLAVADLTEAELAGARLDAANLSGATLIGALLDEAQLAGADLTGVEAGDAVFAGADLSGAVLIDGQFKGADFTAASLDQADARGASFASAEFAKVSAVKATFAGADLTELRAADALDFTDADFSQVRAVESVWSGATLERAVLTWAVFDGADFTGANLQGADFYAAHLKGARFSKANLLDARLATADAFEASFDKADLGRADLRGGNFYAAEFLEARFSETATEGANLRMTKHG